MTEPDNNGSVDMNMMIVALEAVRGYCETTAARPAKADYARGLHDAATDILALLGREHVARTDALCCACDCLMCGPDKGTRPDTKQGRDGR